MFETLKKLIRHSIGTLMVFAFSSMDTDSRLTLIWSQKRAQCYYMLRRIFLLSHDNIILRPFMLKQEKPLASGLCD